MSHNAEELDVINNSSRCSRCEMIIQPFISQITAEELLEFQDGKDLISAIEIQEL